MKRLISLALILGLVSSISSQSELNFLRFYLKLILLKFSEAFLCYWTSWASSLSNSNPSLCTHVSYAFVDVDSNGNLAFSSGMNSFKSLRSSHPSVKLLFSIGGANYDANSAFKYISGSPSLRANFASNILNYIQSNNLHGGKVSCYN